MHKDYFNTLDKLNTKAGNIFIYRLEALEKQGLMVLSTFPYCLRVLIEGLIRNCGKKGFDKTHVLELAQWKPVSSSARSIIPFIPGRVLLQDFTGLPVLNDMAALRAALAHRGSNPQKVSPRIPTDLVIDHSVQVDSFGCETARRINEEMEFKRNQERYQFLHWSQKAFDHLRIIPPSSGIIHQINLEYLTSMVLTFRQGEKIIAFPDSILGTDSHTTMINSLGVIGWGVGGIEAMAAMLGYTTEFPIPDVIGLRLDGELQKNVTPTDLALTLTSLLRQNNVVGKFVEIFGDAVANLRLEDRAMISNMSPESGATMTYFPVDERTIEYLRLTGRSEAQINLIETYFKEQGLFHTERSPIPSYTEIIQLNLSTITPVLAGPKRPYDLIPRHEIAKTFQTSLTSPIGINGFGVTLQSSKKKCPVTINGNIYHFGHGTVVLAAITSCTNTSNPKVMIGAGLLAKKAVEKGLQTKPYVKTSFAPGSQTVTAYLQRSGLMKYLEQLGFYLVGYGCTTCIGNSGPLPGDIEKVIDSERLITAAVLSGNRNFEGRIHQSIKASYLTSPLMVVAYALVGNMNFDFTSTPLSEDKKGNKIFLEDIWPLTEEIEEIIGDKISPQIYLNCYADVLSHNKNWNNLISSNGNLFNWNAKSTYIKEPPFLSLKTVRTQANHEVRQARVLAMLGDSITTDHISPAGIIPPDSVAGKYLLERGTADNDLNTYGSRRGNHEVLARGTFSNIHLRNLLTPEKEGGYTRYLPSQEILPIFQAAERYRREGTSLIIIAGKQYGIGSSRDWAAKGPLLLGVRAVIAESFERIHRSNLALMGILPLQFFNGENTRSLNLSGDELFTISDIQKMQKPGEILNVKVEKHNHREIQFHVKSRIDTPLELIYFQQGGIFYTMLTNLLK